MEDSKESLKIQSKGIITTVAVVIMLIFFGACEKKTEAVSLTFLPDSSYTMRATDVSTLISDSGITRYRLLADEWLVFSKAAEPYWYFPSGMYVEKFDSLFQAEGSVRADTAYYYTDKGEWVLIGNVKIANLQNEKFESQKIYWDQKQKLIHSPEYIRIEQKDKIITGYGFESNEEMTRYRIFMPQGIFPVPKDRNDTIQTQQEQ